MEEDNENNQCFQCSFFSMLIIIAPLIFIIVFSYEQLRSMDSKQIQSNLMAALVWVIVCIPLLYIARKRFNVSVSKTSVSGCIGLIRKREIKIKEIQSIKRYRIMGFFDVLELKNRKKVFRVYLFMFKDRESLSKTLIGLC